MFDRRFFLENLRFGIGVFEFGVVSVRVIIVVVWFGRVLFVMEEVM